MFVNPTVQKDLDGLMIDRTIAKSQMIILNSIFYNFRCVEFWIHLELLILIGGESHHIHFVSNYLLKLESTFTFHEVSKL